MGKLCSIVLYDVQAQEEAETKYRSFIMMRDLFVFFIGVLSLLQMATSDFVVPRGFSLPELDESARRDFLDGLSDKIAPGVFRVNYRQLSGKEIAEDYEVVTERALVNVTDASGYATS